MSKPKPKRKNERRFFHTKKHTTKINKKIKKTKILTTIQTIQKNHEDKKIKEQKEKNAFCYIDL